jgi:hypothetical protein
MDFARRKRGLVFVDRRAEIRERVFLRIGKLLTAQDSLLAECTLYDICSIGVRVKILTNEVMPERLRFFDAVGGYTRMARLAWQDGQMTGMEFTSRPISLNEQEFQTFGQDWQP